MFCDLHAHSTASDGTTAPSDLPALAMAAGLRAVALTDHDTTEGLPACAAASAAAGIAFVPGIEVSADPALEARDVPADPPRRGTLHILGLFVRHDDPRLADVHDRMRAARDSRNPAIVERLNELGVPIHYAEVQQIADEQGTRIIGRPHIAAVLMRKGVVKTVRDAFRTYIGQGAPAYVRRDRLPADQAIDAIHHAGGLAVLAHPIQLGLREPGGLEQFLARLKALGLDGIETHHSDHDAAQVRRYTDLARQFDLMPSGGSDFHGARKAVQLGSQNVPLDFYERLRKVVDDRVDGAATGK